MENKLLKQFVQLENSKAELLLLLENIAPDKLIHKPNNKSWSIVQVIGHLIKIEEGTINYLNKKLSYNPPLKKASPIAAFKTWLLNISLDLPVRYKTNNILEESSNNIPYNEAISAWDESRINMKTFLDKLSEEQLNAAIHKNFAVGRISIYQQMSFIQTHFERHAKQIKKLVVVVN